MEEMYKRLAQLMMATEGTPLKLGNVEFWIDAAGPWKGMLSYSPASNRWDSKAMGQSVAQLAACYPEVERIINRFVDERKTAWAHEEALAGLAKERPHSRIRTAHGMPVRWVYQGDGTMGKPLEEKCACQPAGYCVRHGGTI